MADNDQGGSTDHNDTTPPADNVDTTAAVQDKQPDQKTFTQAELDKIVQDRLARQRAQFQDYDDLKTKAAEFDKLNDAQKTELQKANDRAAALERDLATATEERQASLLRAAVVAEAAKRNVVDPDAAVSLIDRSAIEFDDDGAPTNIAEAMDSLLTAKPYLAGGGRRGSADLGARHGDAGQVTREQLKTMTPEQIQQAEREGKLATLLSGG